MRIVVGVDAHRMSGALVGVDIADDPARLVEVAGAIDGQHR